MYFYKPAIFFMGNKLEFIVKGIKMIGAPVRSLFTGNSLPKGPVGFKQNPNFLANPIQQY